MPDIIRNALAKYKDRFTEWKDANDKYMRGELIPNHLALALVKAEMGRHPNASAYFLEGFPREARQVEDFERQVKAVNMAIIIDYDERTLREHMERRGISMDVIDQRIKEFKQKTLPSAKYFDDQKLLHLVPGEKDDQTIFERMKKLVWQAMETGIPVYNSHPPVEAVARGDPISPPRTATGAAAAAAIVENGVKTPSSKPPSAPGSKPASKPSTSHGHQEDKPPSRPTSRNGSRSGSASSKKSTARSSKETPKPKTPQSNGVPETAAEPAPAAAPTAAVATVAVVHEPPKTGEKPPPTAKPIPKGLPNNAPVLLIIGAPGSNKSAIAQRIAKKYDGFVMFSMGDLLRRKVRETRGDELWERIGKKIDQGEAVPMKLCREVLYQAIHDVGATSWGYVIEGYPRNTHQAQDFEQQLERIDLAILIDCTEQFCADTVKKRYEIGLQDKNERADDAPNVFQHRLELFKANCLPMLKYFDDKNKLRVVDGDLEEDKIFNEVTHMIDNSLFIEDNGSGKSLESSKNGSLVENTGQPSQAPPPLAV